MRIVYEQCRLGYRIVKIVEPEPVVLLPNRHFLRKVVTIGSHAFDSCKNVEYIKLPEYLLEIENHAFEEMESLQRVFVGKHLLVVGDCAFAKCVNLERFSALYSKLNIVGREAFSGCKNLSSCTLPDSVSVIGAAAFRGCESLTRFDNPNCNRVLEDSTFKGCSMLENLFIADGVFISSNALVGTPLQG